jgi:hypothetical protein
MDVQCCSVSGWAQDRDRSAEGLDPVFEADEARAAAGIGAPYPIVADREGEGSAVALYPQVDD